MKATGQALLNLASFVALSDNSTIDPDAARKAIEQLIADLNRGDSSDREYLRALILQDISVLSDRTPHQQALVDFYLDFMEHLN